MATLSDFSAVSGHVTPYVVVHVVSQESLADLIGPQVIDPMRTQAEADGAQRPARVLAVFLEPARVAVGRRLRECMASFRARAPEIEIVVHPFVSRLGIRRNAWLLAKRLRRRSRDCRVVFHCRGENAVEWAAALQRHIPRAGIVADIRGAWPEEFLFARGFDGPEGADSDSLRSYRELRGRLHDALRRAGRVFSVSPGMLSWLAQEGATQAQLTYVPCCVRAITFDAAAREEVRGALGLGGKIVLTYIGTLSRYQHIEDGVVPFVRAMLEAHLDVHFLGLVTDSDHLRRVLQTHGVPDNRATVVSVAQPAVARYLMAADAGLLLRAPSRMNRLSQPTKLGEYLAAGLPIVVSRETGQVDRLIEENNAGFAVNAFGVPWDELVSEAERVWRGLRSGGEQLRRNALALCEREFLWTSYTERVRDAYATALMTAD